MTQPTNKIAKQKNTDKYNAIYAMYLSRLENGNKIIPKAKFNKIANAYYEFIVKLVLDGFEVQLNARLGSLEITGKKTIPKFNDEGKVSNLPVDWKATNELWRTNEDAKAKKIKVFIFNEHSNGIQYSIDWKTADATFRNKYLYDFKAAKYSFRRKLPQMIRNGKEY